MYDAAALAPAGSTGNNTHAGYSVNGVYDAVAFQFIVTAVGATPTVTYKYQGSANSTTGSDGDWFDVGYITDASDTISQATRSATTQSTQIAFLSNPVARRYKWFRVVTSANTNVTYRAEIYPLN